MPRVAVETLIATTVFVLITLLWHGADDPFGTLTSGLVFAMVYAAIGTAFALFRSKDQ